jgi:hypothetical protein
MRRSRGVVIGGRKSEDGSAFLVSDAGTEKHEEHNHGTVAKIKAQPFLTEPH